MPRHYDLSVKELINEVAELDTSDQDPVLQCFITLARFIQLKQSGETDMYSLIVAKINAGIMISKDEARFVIDNYKGPTRIEPEYLIKARRRLLESRQ